MEEPSPFGEVLPVTQTEFSPFADEPHAAQESCEGLLSTNPFEAPILQPFQEADSPVTSSSNPFGDPEPAQPVIPAEVEEDEGAETPKEPSAEPDFGPSTSVDPVAEGGEDCERHSQEQEEEEEAELEQLEDEACEPQDDPVLDRGDSVSLEPDAAARYSPYVEPPEPEGAGEQDDEEEDASVVQPPVVGGGEQHHFAIQVGYRTIVISPDLQDNFTEF